MSAIAIIGIRSGSKGLEHKNIKTFCGKPLVHWIIKAALDALKIDRVIEFTEKMEVPSWL